MVAITVRLGFEIWFQKSLPKFSRKVTVSETGLDLGKNDPRECRMDIPTRSYDAGVA